MATYTLPLAGGIHKKVQGGTPDRINVPVGRTPKVVRVQVPWSEGSVLYARGDSTTAVAAADGTYPVYGGVEPVDIVVQPGDWISVCTFDGYPTDSYIFYSAYIVSG